MPTTNDLFPQLDYDVFNKQLDFLNSPVNQVNLSSSPFDSMMSQTFQDGVETVDTNNSGSVDSEINVNEKDVSSVSENWGTLSRAERIQQVKEQASGMPIVSTIDLRSLKKTAERMEKKGMYKESATLFKIAQNFSKELTIVENIINGQPDTHSEVKVYYEDQAQQPISISKVFKNIDEAQAFYGSIPLNEVKELESSMNHFGFTNEAMSLRRFLRQVAIASTISFKPGEWIKHDQYGEGIIAFNNDDGTYEVFFGNHPTILSGAPNSDDIIQGKTIFLGPETKVPKGFYRVLNNPKAVIKKVTVTEDGEEKQKVIRIFRGRLKLIDQTGKEFVIEDYPYGKTFYSTKTIDGNYLQPIQKEKFVQQKPKYIHPWKVKE